MESNQVFSEKIKKLKTIWLVLVIVQLVFALIGIAVSAYDAQGGGIYGSGSAVGGLGLILGLVFFSNLLKQKKWARIALLVLSILMILTSIGGFFNAAKITSMLGSVFAVLGSVIGIFWAILVIKYLFFDNDIKIVFNESLDDKK